jgi:hypothetical protein
MGLDNAIQAAADQLIAESKAATGKEPKLEASANPEVELEDSVEESSEESSDESTRADELSESQLIEARNLYKALTGPQANAIVAAMAQQIGILPNANQQPLTKKEETAARREIKDIVKDALGPEYAFLQDKIGRIFDEVAAQQNADHEARFVEIQQSQVERQVVDAYNSLASETKGQSKQFENRMAQLSEEIPIGNMNVETYMRRLYTLASNEKKASPQKVADQIRRNAGDVPNRLRTSSAGPAEPAHKVPEKKMSLDESVNWALSELQKGRK